MKGGTGTREQLQESVHVGDPEARGKLTKVIEIVDLAGGRASLDYSDVQFASAVINELYAFSGSPHTDPMVLANMPTSRALFQSALWFPGYGSGLVKWSLSRTSQLCI
jgi:hypothetical protein